MHVLTSNRSAEVLYEFIFSSKVLMAFTSYLLKKAVFMRSAALCTAVTRETTISAAPKAPPAGRE